MRSRRILSALAATLAAAGLLAGCARVVEGSGSTVRTPVSVSDPGAQAATPCPHVVFPQAKLSFDCVTGGFTARFDSPTWPLVEAKTVETRTGWVVEEGAGHWGSADGHTLGDIASAVRQHMIDVGGYGAKPNLDTVVAKDTTVGGVTAHLLQTTVTLDPSWAKSSGTKVKQEKLWIVALQVGADDVSLWYTSIPDLVKSLWAKVPATIASIHVG
jgi:hypothetical protein